MTRLHDGDASVGIVDRVDDPVSSLANAIPIIAHPLFAGGSVVSIWTRAKTRRRSFLLGNASISLAADGLIRSLYLATPLQILDHISELDGLFLGPFLERGEIFCVLGETVSDRIVDELGNRTIRLGRLEA